MTAIMHHDPAHLAALRRGSTVRGNADWPNAFLHELGPSMDGRIDKRRLPAMADYIESLELSPNRGEMTAPGPLGHADGVNGRYPCLGYVLRPGGEGFGAVCFPAGKERAAPAGYYLSGFGIACWAWGRQQGMNAVATNEAVGQLHDVFIAEPVRLMQVPGFTLGDVTPRHVADAIRQFIDCEDATRAWYMASGLKPETASEPPAKVPVPEPVSEPAPAATILTVDSSWKGLFAADRYGDMRIMSDRRVGELEAECERIEEERDRVRADLAKWRKRQKAALLLAKVDDDDGTD